MGTYTRRLASLERELERAAREHDIARQPEQWQQAVNAVISDMLADAAGAGFDELDIGEREAFAWLCDADYWTVAGVAALFDRAADRAGQRETGRTGPGR